MSKPLGIAQGAIADERMTASSVYAAPKSINAPWLARAFANAEAPTAGAWRPAVDSSEEWLQVDLGREQIVSALATQGQPRSSNWIKTLRLDVSLDGVVWKAVPGVLHANRDASGVAIVPLISETSARFLRVHAVDWHGHIALRLEVIGFSPECPPVGSVVGASASSHELPCAAAPAPGAAAAHLNARRAATQSARLASLPALPPAVRGWPLGIADLDIPDSSLTASSEHVPNAFFARTDAEPDCRELHARLRAAEDAERASAGNRGESTAPVDSAAREAETQRFSTSLHGALAPAARHGAVTSAARVRAAAGHRQTTAKVAAPRFSESALSDATAAPPDADADAAVVDKARAAVERAAAAAVTAPAVPHAVLGHADCGIKTVFSAAQARLNNMPAPYKTAGWRPATDAVGEWLQVDLGRFQEVDAVLVQGTAGTNRWVTQFQLQHSSDGKVWTRMPSPFAGNADDDTPVKLNLPSPILARYLRFVVDDWNRGAGGGIGLRVELYGPGAGEGCMLRCFAAWTARARGLTSVDSQLAVFSNAAAAATGSGVMSAFLELEGAALRRAETSVNVAAVAELAAAVGVPTAELRVSCCGCPCCGAIDRSCARRYRTTRPARAAPRKSVPQKPVA